MKILKVVSAMMIATTLGTTATVVTPAVSAQAKTKMSLKTIPKKFRGTWYHYEKYDGYMYQKISATTLKTRDKGAASHYNQSMTIHQFNLSTGISDTKTNRNNPHNWMFAYKSGSKYIMDSWDAYFEGPKYRSTYSMTTRNYKGKKVKVIKNTPTNSGTWYIYSPSKAMAKHLWNLDNKK